jgi:hypothetical protein
MMEQADDRRQSYGAETPSSVTVSNQTKAGFRHRPHHRQDGIWTARRRYITNRDQRFSGDLIINAAPFWWAGTSGNLGSVTLSITVR